MRRALGLEILNSQTPKHTWLPPLLQLQLLLPLFIQSRIESSSPQARRIGYYLAIFCLRGRSLLAADNIDAGYVLEMFPMGLMSWENVRTRE
eukprot:1727528-Rhodomonas_salina.4